MRPLINTYDAQLACSTQVCQSKSQHATQIAYVMLLLLLLLQLPSMAMADKHQGKRKRCFAEHGWVRIADIPTCALQHWQDQALCTCWQSHTQPTWQHRTCW
jgi:hypothetical protein